ncbi:MAG: cation diffusion facilitator family transporter [Actinomycetales bacterium]|nr:cation diffusion facilitator family transporter [Actinomycetales bacterium]
MTRPAATRLRLRGHPGPSDGESRRTALLAISANLGVALAKGLAALLTGSAAMLAETLHSLADVVNEALLLLGVRRSRRAADSAHPRGYGRDRYFWSLLAAVGIFLAGGLASVAEGVDAARSPRALDHVPVALAVLSVSFLLEGASWAQARRQVQDDAADHDVDAADLIDVTSDPTPVTVFLEDSAALWGLALAAVGVLGHDLTGQPWWDAGASVGVGLLLMWVAVRLVVLNRRLLLAPSVPPTVLDHVTSVARAEAWVLDVPDSVVVYVGPGTVSVSLDVEPDVSLPSEELVTRLAALRQHLIDHEGVTSVAITLVPARSSGSHTLAGRGARTTTGTAPRAAAPDEVRSGNVPWG